MKKITYSKFGGPEVLQIAEVAIPEVQETTVLIKVKAVSINPLDWKIRNGEMKLMSGSKFPKGIGIDFSGIVEETGTAVNKYKKGDEVYGILDVFKGEALSEYITAQEKDIAIKPRNISFEQAAATPVVGSAALQILKTLVNLKKGTEVLINGASGGVGTFAIQLAKIMGADVTGVCSTRNVDLVKSIGADHVIDYTKEDFTKGDQHYDVLFDNVQNHTFSERRRALTPNGICLNVGLGGAGWHEDTALHLLRSFTTPLMSKFTSQKFKFFIAELNHNDLAYLADLMQTGKMKPVIDRTYKSLSETPQALVYLEEGHARGKVVINVE